MKRTCSTRKRKTESKFATFNDAPIPLNPDGTKARRIVWKRGKDKSATLLYKASSEEFEKRLPHKIFYEILKNALTTPPNPFLTT